MGHKVLIVDDSQMVRAMAAKVLRAAGYEVVEAIDGEEALRVLDDDASVAAVVSDVNMPRMNGIEFLEAYATRPAPRRPVVILTTESEVFIVQRAKALGARGWLFKPLKPEVLVAAVEKLCATSAVVAPQKTARVGGGR